MICYAVKSITGEYWCGMNHWDKQLRMARLYNSIKYASLVLDDHKIWDGELQIVKVEINEVSE